MHCCQETVLSLKQIYSKSNQSEQRFQIPELRREKRTPKESLGSGIVQFRVHGIEVKNVIRTEGQLHEVKKKTKLIFQEI